MKYSDVMVEWLVQLGYTHCFFVGGGNIMHLVESCSRRLTCVPTVHEVAAGIAAEYFNEANQGGRAFAMVTAGPGLTNAVTGIAGAWLESRELLVIGGQVKTADLARGQVRQRGIQEIDGVSIVKPITVRAERIETTVDRATFADIVESGSRGRKGPVFLEVPLDIQARDVDEVALSTEISLPAGPATTSAADIAALAERIAKARRPVFLLGGGVARTTTDALTDRFAEVGIPVATTWNAADRLDSEHPVYFGRPNTWGQRYANLVLQQADLLIAVGTRLSLQQSGFNWQEFIPGGEIVHVDCDQAELDKGHPTIHWPICADANALLLDLLPQDLGEHADWLAYCNQIKADLPLSETNNTGEAYLSPYAAVSGLSEACTGDDVVIPCSSGGAFTVMMQAFRQKAGQLMITNKGLASMGYGLSGAIGAALATKRRTILIEGDGGFSQNLQEIGTATINDLDLKIFIFDDNGYASIRQTQMNYFNGRYVGCDLKTGLGLPNWQKLFATYDVPVHTLAPGFEKDAAFLETFNTPGVQAFIVPVDPQQTYFPRIASRVVEGGGMVSNPLHRMTPELDETVEARLAAYIPK
ncbi:acetolactate synthase [Caulobacter vibrioides]|nr:acetolactate synthase [Caulobacter vibrioides]